MFKKDSYITGILAGIVLAVLWYVILFGLKNLALTFFSPAQNFTQTKMMFASAALNILPMRYFYVAREQQKTAQGILLVSVITVIAVLVAF